MEDLFEVPDVQCCGCNEDISFSDHVRCTECYKETVNFCIKCFQTGTEFGSHKRGHNYKVEHPLGSVMFTHSNESNPWGWKEDKMLIRALNKYKLTHWDEMSKKWGLKKTFKEASEHFECCLLRSQFGRYAFDKTNLRAIQNAEFINQIQSSVGAVCAISKMDSTNPSKYKCIGDGIREMNRADIRTIDLNDENWFDLMRKKLAEFRTKYQCGDDFLEKNDIEKLDLLKMNIPVREWPHSWMIWPNDIENVSFGSHSTRIHHDMNLLSRFSQRFTRSMKHSQKTGHVKAEDHNCRSFRSSYRTNDYISNANVEWKDDEDEYASSNSSEIGVPTVSKSSRLKRKRRLVACHDPYSYGMQTSEEEEGGGCSISISLSPGANGDGHLDEILAKDVNANLKKFSLSKNIHLCEATPTTMYRELIILFDENDEKYLRNMQPEQFFAGSLPDTLPLHKIKKLRKDDMEVLCYLPKRDEFELESNNHAERLISRLNYESFGELDEEDEKLLHDVKLAKFLRYTRIIQGRRATHAVINEHEIIARYIDTKIKKTSEKSRGFNYPPQYYAMLRRQERFRNILTKAHQCLLQSELQQLQELLIENESLNDRIRELERLQNDGVTILKPSQKLGPEYLRARRKKKTFRTGGTSEQKKATQLWNRYKRWTHNQRLNEIPCSDTEGKAEC